MNDLDKQKLIFGKLFSLINKFQAIGDQVFSGEMTVRQWLFTIAVAQFGAAAPTLSEVAELMGSSHQNAKQLALKLHRKGYLSIERDIKDLRAIRLCLTGKCYSLWEQQRVGVKHFLENLFTDLSRDEIDTLYCCLNKLYAGILRVKRTL